MIPAIKIGFIGAGNMAAALIQGLIKQGFPAAHIQASDKNETALAHLQKNVGIQTCTDNCRIISASDLVILAVKPQIMASVCAEIRAEAATHKPCFISIAAGVSIARLAEWLGQEMPIIRCMPNTPALIGEGAAALYANALVSPSQKQDAEWLFKAAGIVEWIAEEEQFHAITALSGSGPAYFFLFMEVLQKIAAHYQLPESISKNFVLQTALGSAKLALQSQTELAVLRQNVTSPGGTTEAALKVLQSPEFEHTLEKAIAAACQRSKEL